MSACVEDGWPMVPVRDSGGHITFGCT